MLEANCVQYGSHYKPEGLLQQYANKIRFSAFGYLNQGGNVREGGAMRAPMGFIGPDGFRNRFPPRSSPTPDPSGMPTTGIMNVNPDTVSAAASGVTQSGVMNYLNKFGEYGAATGGQVYKTYDNVGELYYAAVRYFENLGNVPEWTNNTTPAILDGFPALTVYPSDTTPSPNPGASILYTCQKNFILGIGDDHTWYDYDVGGSTYAGPGGRAMPAAVTADTFNQASLWTTELQNIEGITPDAGVAESFRRHVLYRGLGVWRARQRHTSDLSGAQTISTYWMDVAENQRLENLNPVLPCHQVRRLQHGNHTAGSSRFRTPAPPHGPAGIRHDDCHNTGPIRHDRRHRQHGWQCAPAAG